MGMNAKTKCIIVMKSVVGHGFEEEVPAKTILRMIKEWIGVDKRTQENYIEALQDFGFLSTTNGITFQINKKKLIHEKVLQKVTIKKKAKKHGK